MLTQRQRLYAEARELGLSITDAAVKAGCPAKTAPQAGSRLEKHVAVIEHRQRLKAAKNEPSTLTADKLTTDPKEYLESLVKNPMEDPRVRLEAAKALLPYVHKKIGEVGKKETQREAAKAATAKFGGRPHLQAVK